MEARSKSGALITSEYAADFGRDVFAVPGSVHWKTSDGCHELIRDGGTLIMNAQEVLDYYDFTPAPMEKKILTSPPIELDETEKKVFNLIPFEENITVDEILMQLDDVEPNEISEILLSLEVKKLIAEEFGNYTKVKQL